MRSTNIYATVRLVDRLTPELHRARWHFLHPINHGLPPRGSMARQAMLVRSRLRRVGRELVKAIPGGSSVPWTEVGRIWGRRLEWLGWAYIAAIVIVLAVVWIAGRT